MIRHRQGDDLLADVSKEKDVSRRTDVDLCGSTSGLESACGADSDEPDDVDDVAAAAQAKKTPSSVTIQGERLDQRRMRVTAMAEGRAVHRDVFDPDRADPRKRFARAVAAHVPDADLEEIGAQILRLCIGAVDPCHSALDEDFDDIVGGGGEAATHLQLDGATLELSGGTGHRVVATVKAGGNVIHRAHIDPASSKARADFLATVKQRLPALAQDGLDAIDGQLMGVDAIGHSEESQADTMVRLARDRCELFQAPGEPDPYATIEYEDYSETYAVRSSSFRRWLIQLHYQDKKKAPGGDAVRAAVETLAACACAEGEEHPVHLRVAQHDGAIWLDLCDERWRQVRIDGAGWSVETRSPVRFIRKGGMLPLPAPIQGGSLDLLRQFINVDDHDWRLVIAWILAALRPGLPLPVLEVNGEQGSAKSTACRLIRLLIDPNKAPLRRPPAGERDLAISARNSWIISFENLSNLPTWMSDGLCVLATGGGLATRKLFTDDEEELFDARRPVMLNSIVDVALRGDLADRSIKVTMRAIAEEDRRSEKDIVAGFEAVRPAIMGALLDVLSSALRRLPWVRLERLPRMADFAVLIAAAEPALGWEPGSFEALYRRARLAASQTALEADPVAEALLAWLGDRQEWKGRTKDLLAQLPPPSEHSRSWPRSPQGLSSRLRRLCPDLRRAGIVVISPRDSDRPRLLRIHRADSDESPPATSSGSSGSSELACQAGSSADVVPTPSAEVRRDPTQGRPDTDEPSSSTSTLEPACGAAPDELDEPDDVAGEGSGRAQPPPDRCRCCFGKSWWRPIGSAVRWTCEACHPPVEGIEVERWLPTADEPASGAAEGER